MTKEMEMEMEMLEEEEAMMREVREAGFETLEEARFMRWEV